MTEALNRRLTYHVGADHGGWDLTQVLRFPGTKNFKYASEPLVRTLWDDGRVYSIKQLEHYLPPDEELTPQEVISAAAVFELYQDKLPRWVRRELLAKRTVGRTDRSEMLWKLENACVEAGMSLEEAFAILKGSAWNKFQGRRNEDAQLRRELEKVVENQFKEKPKGADKLHRKSDWQESQEEKEPKGRFVFKPLRDVEEEELEFLWYPYLVRGEVSILEGDPGLGKSYMAMMASAAIASGQRLPSVRKGYGKLTGPVVYFDIENSAGSVTKVRLKHNGFTDPDGKYFCVEQAFSIDDEDALEEIYEYLEQIRPVLIVFDTLNTYIGRADTHKASESTQAINVFKKMAKDFNASVLILRHLTKGGGAAMYRGQGSIAFSGSARIVMSVGCDPKDSDTRVMAVTKINFAPAPKALEFRIEERPKGASEFMWGEFVSLSSQEIMDAATEARSEGKQGQNMQDAMEFLENTITGVALDVEKIYRMGEKRSISSKMIDRAAGKMDIIRKKNKKDGTVTWQIKDSSIMTRAGYTD